MKCYTHAVFFGVETLLHSRPLTTLSTDAIDEPVLTPNRFIVGQLGDKWIHYNRAINFWPLKLASSRIYISYT